jgi:hypothetical protein
MSQPENIFIGPLGQEDYSWSDAVIRQYKQKLFEPAEPFPPKIDGDLLMAMPLNGDTALNQAGYWLDPEAVYLTPQAHTALGIRKLIK